jgi:hypothetical protein
MLNIEIETGNAAFCDPYDGNESEYWEAVELKRILQDICTQLEDGVTSGSLL